ncbi:hypothetical protein [Streptomyces seoulensis]|uniref:hypothetical protein n=1 Tax=Streptomyces seoulensis TaxID=73044 RepID=UPI001FCBE5D9|nr:hypothetical protein [Streptomyces seoulensis]BDH05176.1 hypothetical protein HEK131_24030 [Streptomyces seoulensis]
MSEQQHDPRTRRVPRDLPDQQASHGDDRWDARPDERRAPTQGESADVPDTDEAGAGPRGAPEPAGVRPDQPVPDEPSG